MIMMSLLRLVPAIAASVMTSLVHTAVLALLARGSSTPAASPRSGPTAHDLPCRCRRVRSVAPRRESARLKRPRGAQEDLVSFGRRTARRLG